MSNKKKVLIVEDDYFIYLGLRLQLENAGFYVLGTKHEAVDTFEKAVALIEKDPPHFAILDIIINGEKDGLDVAEYIFQSYNTFMYVLTSTKQEEDRDRAARLSVMAWKLKTENNAAHAVQHIPKPFDADDLCERLLFDQKKMPEPFPLVKTGALFLSRYRRLIRKEESLDTMLQLDFHLMLPWNKIYALRSSNTKELSRSNKPKVMIHMEDGNAYEITRSLGDLLSLAPAYQVRFNKSTVFNMYYFLFRDAEKDLLFHRDETMKGSEEVSADYREEARKRLRLVFHGF